MMVVPSTWCFDVEGILERDTRLEFFLVITVGSGPESALRKSSLSLLFSEDSELKRCALVFW